MLDEAFDESVPLFERLKFVSIFESNLDEFLMVREAVCPTWPSSKQPVDNKSNMTASEQVDAVMARNARAPYPLGSPSLRASRGKLDTLGVHRAPHRFAYARGAHLCNPLLPGLRVAGHLAVGH